MENNIALYTCFDDFNNLENKKFFSITLNAMLKSLFDTCDFNFDYYLYIGNSELSYWKSQLSNYDIHFVTGYDNLDLDIIGWKRPFFQKIFSASTLLEQYDTVIHVNHDIIFLKSIYPEIEKFSFDYDVMCNRWNVGKPNATSDLSMCMFHKTMRKYFTANYDYVYNYDNEELFLESIPCKKIMLDNWQGKWVDENDTAEKLINLELNSYFQHISASRYTRNIPYLKRIDEISKNKCPPYRYLINYLIMPKYYPKEFVSEMNVPFVRFIIKNNILGDECIRPKLVQKLINYIKDNKIGSIYSNTIKKNNKVLFTTVQKNDYVVEMLSCMLKSWLIFNSGWDIKVYCLDNSSEYFRKHINLNVEFINFKDGCKWNAIDNRFINKKGYYVFNTAVTISKLEIIDRLKEKYDYIYMSDIDVVYFNSIETAFNDFVKSNYQIGGVKEYDFEGHISCLDDLIYINAGTMFINCLNIDFNVFDKSIALIPNIENLLHRKWLYCEQDLLNLIFDKKLPIKKMEVDFYNGLFIHYLSAYLKPQSKFDNNQTYMHNTYKQSYYEFAKALDVELPIITFNVMDKERKAIHKHVILFKSLKSRLRKYIISNR